MLLHGPIARKLAIKKVCKMKFELNNILAQLNSISDLISAANYAVLDLQEEMDLQKHSDVGEEVFHNDTDGNQLRQLPRNYTSQQSRRR